MYTLIIHVASTDINYRVEKYILGRHFWGFEGEHWHTDKEWVYKYNVHVYKTHGNKIIQLFTCLASQLGTSTMSGWNLI